jgi:hypothetical protein
VSFQSKKIAWGLGKAVLRSVRFSLYVVLLLIGRVLVPVASLVTVGGLVLFFFSVLVLREHTWLIVFGCWRGLAAGVLRCRFAAGGAGRCRDRERPVIRAPAVPKGRGPMLDVRDIKHLRRQSILPLKNRKQKRTVERKRRN